MIMNAHWDRKSFTLEAVKTKKLRKLLTDYAQYIGGWEKEDGRFYIWLRPGCGYTFDIGSSSVSGESETALVANFLADITVKENV